jgi:acetylornithine deacetylase/succinyl-diaminopimelate desuccinylase-like protein
LSNGFGVAEQQSNAVLPPRQQALKSPCFQLGRPARTIAAKMTVADKLLRDLIALPSVNPAFWPGNDARAGEKRVGDYIAGQVKREGLETDFQEVLPGRCNVLVRLAPRGKMKHRVLLAPHLDTVNVVSEKQFVPRSANGRIYGRGACDTKGSVAVMLAALRILTTQNRRPAATEIMFAGLIDEENAQAGSRALAATGLKAGLAIIGEPTRLRVVTAHKGSLWLRLETHGKAAHGSRPDLGKNAVHEMARAVDVIESSYARQLRQRRHPLLGPPTVNVGYIRGGTQPNIVPAFCTAGVDRRTLPGETESSVRAEMKAWLSRHGVTATFGSDRLPACPALETDYRLPLVQKLLAVARQNRPAGEAYFCDAAILAQAGVPSVVFGPGDIAQAHTADEWISQKSLEQGTRLLTQFLSSLP